MRGRCSLSALCRDVRGDGVAAVHDHGEGLAVVGLLEGGVATHQHVEDDSQAPDVCKKQQQQQFRLHSPWTRRFPTPGTLGGAAHQCSLGCSLEVTEVLPLGEGDHTPTKAGKDRPIPISKQVSRDFTKAVEVLSPCPGRDRKASPELYPPPHSPLSHTHPWHCFR